MAEVENDFDALVLALRLAIDAPDEEKSAEICKTAHIISQSLSEFEVERAKREAIRQNDEGLPY